MAYYPNLFPLLVFYLQVDDLALRKSQEFILFYRARSVLMSLCMDLEYRRDLDYLF